jgi:hypothetical protein
VIDDARRKRDDVTFRRLVAQRSTSINHEKAAATQEALALQRRALEQRSADMEQRKLARDAEHRARLDVELAAQRKAEARTHVQLGNMSLYRWLAVAELVLGADRPFCWQSSPLGLTATS